MLVLYFINQKVTRKVRRIVREGLTVVFSVCHGNTLAASWFGCNEGRSVFYSFNKPKRTPKPLISPKKTG